MSRSASSFLRKELKVPSNNNSLIIEDESPPNDSIPLPNRSASPIMFQEASSSMKKKATSRPQSSGASIGGGGGMNNRMNRSRIEAPLPPPTMEQLRASSPILQRSTSPIMYRASSPIMNRASSPIFNRASSPVNRSTSSLGFNNQKNSVISNRIDREIIRASTDMKSPMRRDRTEQLSRTSSVKRSSSACGRSVGTSSVISSTNSQNNQHNTTYNSNFTSNYQNTFVPPKVNSSIANGTSTTTTNNTNNNGTFNSGTSPTNKELINQYYAKQGLFIKQNEKHVPTQLRDLDFTKSNDVLEVVKDKIHGLSPSLSEAFRRIKQATGYTGGKVRSEDFKKAIIKDFHLLDEVPTDLPNFIAVQQYQNEQVKKIDEFIRMADPNNEGAFGYSDFNRAMEQLEKHLGTNTTTAQRESRYCGTMNHEAIRRRRERNEQQIERLLDPKKDKAPYGVHDDLVNSINQSNYSYTNKLENLRNSFPLYGETDRIPLTVFRETLKKFDRYILDVDLDQMIDSLNGKKRGYVSLNDFMTAYGFETIKSKSFRGSYESVKPLQWPSTLEEQISTSEKIRDLREKKTRKKLKGRVNNTRTNILRVEEIRRNTSNSQLDGSSTRGGSSFENNSSSNGSTRSFMKTPNYLFSQHGSKSIRLSNGGSSSVNGGGSSIVNGVGGNNSNYGSYVTNDSDMSY